MFPLNQIPDWIRELHAAEDPAQRRTLLRLLTETAQGDDALLPHAVVVALLWALRDPDPSVKRLAMAWLPRLDRDNPQVEDVAIAHIYDKDVRVREGATFFLWLVSSKRCQRIMREIVLTNDPRFPNKTWVFKLVANEDFAVEVLLPYLTDETALEAVLGRLNDIRDARIVPAIVRAIETPNLAASVRTTLFNALNRREDVAMNLVPHLQRWLRRTHPTEVREVLISLCQNYGDASLTKPLLLSMQNEPSLLLALPQMDFIEHERKLAFLLGQLHNWDLQPFAIPALGWLGDPAAITPIIGYLPRNEEVVVIALANIGGPQARDLLLNLLYRYWDDERTLKTIVGALDYIGDPTAAPHLVPLLYELRRFVTAEAVRALVGLGNPVVIPDLIAKLDDHRDPDDGRTHGHTMSELAARALERFGTPAALAALARHYGA